MEGEPNKERKFKTSEITELLRAKGFDNPEVKKVFMNWVIQREKETDKGTPKDRIIFNMERADLYSSIGDIDGALDALDDARTQSFHHNKKELYNKILDLMKKL